MSEHEETPEEHRKKHHDEVQRLWDEIVEKDREHDEETSKEEE